MIKMLRKAYGFDWKEWAEIKREELKQWVRNKIKEAKSNRKAGNWKTPYYRKCYIIQGHRVDQKDQKYSLYKKKRK